MGTKDHRRTLTLLFASGETFMRPQNGWFLFTANQQKFIVVVHRAETADNNIFPSLIWWDFEILIIGCKGIAKRTATNSLLFNERDHRHVLTTFPMCSLLWDELSIRLMDALMESTRTSIRNRISDNFLLSCALFHLKPQCAPCANSSVFAWHQA